MNHKRISRAHPNQYLSARIFRRLSVVWLGAWAIVIIAQHLHGDPTNRWAYVLALAPAVLFYSVPPPILAKRILPALLLVYAIEVVVNTWDLLHG